MTTRSNPPGSHREGLHHLCGGAGTTTVAVPLTVPTHSHLSGHRVTVDFDSRALDVMGQPPNNPQRRVAAHRSHRGANREGS